MRNHFKLSNVKNLEKLDILYVGSGFYLGCRKNKIFKLSNNETNFELVCKLKISFIDLLFINLRLYQRFRRLIFYNVVPIGEGSYFVNFAKKIGLVNPNGVFNAISGIENKCKILNNALCKDEFGNLVFGEYIANKNRKLKVNVYKFNVDESSLQIIYTFAAGLIRHIHGIYRDPFSGFYYLLTGDRPNECSIFFTRDDFKSIEILGSGDESWRTVSIVFTQKYIYYAMDAEFTPNKIYKINKQTKKRHEIGSISGPVYYSALYKKYPVFIVTAELCPSQVDIDVKVLVIERDQILEICSFKKDFTSIRVLNKFFTKLFLPGTFHLPFNNDNAVDKLFLSGIGIKKADNRVFMLSSSNGM